MTYMSLFWNEIVEAGYYDKVFKNGEITEYGYNKLKELQKKWCLENQKDNYK